MSRSEKLQEKIENLMKDVPELPNGFENWIKKSAFKDNKYIFYKRINSKIYGICSYCGKQVEISKAKHKGTGKCPACNKKIIYKAINKANRYIDTKIVSIIQKMNDGENYVVRYIEANLIFKDYEDNTENFPGLIPSKLTDPKLAYWEGSREIIKVKNEKSTYEEYEELYDWGNDRPEWKKERKRSMFFNKKLLRDSNPFIYKRNLNRLIKNSPWNYCGLNYLKKDHINITDYIYTYETYPALEMISKLNCTNLLEEIIYRYRCYGGIGGVLRMHDKMLGLNKNVFNTFVRLNLGFRGIEFANTIREIGKNLTDEQIQWAISNSDTETFTQLLRFTTPQKIINYVEKFGNGENKHFLTTWRDYLQQCGKLKLDIKSSCVLFPKDLEEKHKEYTRLIKLMIDEELDRGIREQYKKWNKPLAYQSGNLRIEVAGNHKLILEEGVSLKHCVGSARYSENMAKGKRLILFLRNNNEPYYTIEFDVEELKIVQNRGIENEAPSVDVVKFINKWKVKKLLTIQNLQKKSNIEGGQYISEEEETKL